MNHYRLPTPLGEEAYAAFVVYRASLSQSLGSQAMIRARRAAEMDSSQWFDGKPASPLMQKELRRIRNRRRRVKQREAA